MAKYCCQVAKKSFIVSNIEFFFLKFLCNIKEQGSGSVIQKYESGSTTLVSKNLHRALPPFFQGGHHRKTEGNDSGQDQESRTCLSRHFSAHLSVEIELHTVCLSSEHIPVDNGYVPRAHLILFSFPLVK